MISMIGNDYANLISSLTISNYINYMNIIKHMTKNTFSKIKLFSKMDKD